MSLMATTVKSFLCLSMTLRRPKRPMRPKPLIATLAVMNPPLPKTKFSCTQQMLKTGAELVRAANILIARCRFGQQSELFRVFEIFFFESNHILAGNLVRWFPNIDNTNPRFSGLLIEQVGKVQVLELAVYQTYQSAGWLFVFRPVTQEKVYRSVTQSPHIFAIK